MSDALPRYARIAVELREAITEGTYPPGALLPSLADLKQRHGVTVQTARRAVAELTRWGLAETRPGVGTVVTPRRPIRHQPARAYVSQPADAPTHPPALYVGAVEVTEKPAPDELATILDLEPETPVIVRRRVYFADDARPVQVATSYLAAHLARGSAITSPDAIDADDPPQWPAALSDATGLPIALVLTATNARVPVEEETAALHVTTPVLTHAATTYTETRQPIDHTEIVWPGNAVRLTDAYQPVGP